MPKRFLLILAFAVTLALTAVDSAWADRINGYPTCGASPQSPGAADSDSSCAQGAAWGAVLVAHHERHVRYRLCVTAPSGQRHCILRHTNRRGHRSIIRLYGRYSQLGHYVFRWYAHGHLVEKHDFHLQSEGV